MISIQKSATVIGLDGHIVDVEVDIQRGMPAFNIVGLPERSIKESKERIRSAIKNLNYHFPTERITVNLAPADIKKEGAFFDLPIAIGILSASKMIVQKKRDMLFLGELALNGNIRDIKGVLPMATGAFNAGIKTIVVPYDNGNEASVIEGLKIIPVKTLQEAIQFVSCEKEFSPHVYVEENEEREYDCDFEDIKGLAFAKRAFEIAAAGSHNILMIGPPGTGKTMLAKRFITILPMLNTEESIETTKIHSIRGYLKKSGLIRIRPFRSPHHTISDVALIGGGKDAHPGEVSLAHNGVLFLDEFPEFSKNIIEALRQPLEDGVVTVSRAQNTFTYPSRFHLIAAMNPCRCGYYGDPVRNCTCTAYDIMKYVSKISGPILDRIDIHIEVPRVDFLKEKDKEEENSDEIRKRVERVVKIQSERFSRMKSIRRNAHISAKYMKRFCDINTACTKFLQSAVEHYGFSPRSINKIIKVSKTIADFENSENIREEHIAEAIQMRMLDNKYFYKF